MKSLPHSPFVLSVSSPPIQFGSGTQIDPFSRSNSLSPGFVPPSFRKTSCSLPSSSVTTTTSSSCTSFRWKIDDPSSGNKRKRQFERGVFRNRNIQLKVIHQPHADYQSDETEPSLRHGNRIVENSKFFFQDNPKEIQNNKKEDGKEDGDEMTTKSDEKSSFISFTMGTGGNNNNNDPNNNNGDEEVKRLKSKSEFKQIVGQCVDYYKNFRGNQIKARHDIFSKSNDREDQYGNQKKNNEKTLHELVEYIEKEKGSIQLNSKEDWPIVKDIMYVIGANNLFLQEQEIQQKIALGYEQEVIKMEEEVLSDICSLYSFLKDQNILQGYGLLTDHQAYLPFATVLPKDTNEEEIEKRLSIKLEALSPNNKNGGLSAGNLWTSFGFIICLFELVICYVNNWDSFSVVTLTLFFLFSDRLFFKGFLFDAFCKAVVPNYKERIVRHEAGHFLVAYLLGLPIQDISITPNIYNNMLGQAGTVFFDKVLYKEVNSGKISQATIDRYSTVLMAGIASEAIHYQNAQGGASDENALISLLLSIGGKTSTVGGNNNNNITNMNFGNKNGFYGTINMSGRWNYDKIRNQARWSALRAGLILKDYNYLLEVLVQKLLQGATLGECIEVIENEVENQIKDEKVEILLKKWSLPPPLPAPENSLSSEFGPTSLENNNNNNNVFSNPFLGRKDMALLQSERNSLMKNLDLGENFSSMLNKKEEETKDRFEKQLNDLELKIDKVNSILEILDDESKNADDRLKSVEEMEKQIREKR